MAIWALKETFTSHNSSNNLTLIIIAVSKINFILTIWMVSLESSLIHISVLLSEHSLALSWVKLKLPLVSLILLCLRFNIVEHSSFAMELPILELTFVDSTVSPLLEAFSCHLSIFEFTSIPWAISHDEGWAAVSCIFYPVFIRALVLEKWVLVVSVGSLTMSQLCHRIDIADISILLRTIFQWLEMHRYFFLGHWFNFTHCLNYSIYFYY